MAVEILETGAVIVDRADRDELLAVRDGAWSYDQLLEASERLGQRIEAAKATSRLPREPDERAINALCTRLVEQALGWN